MTQHMPSFSVIIETENLATADIEGLTRSLDSICRQTVSMEHAREVFVVDSGDVPSDILTALRARFSWLTLLPVPNGLDYYAAKMRAAHACSGDVCVFCDSDCSYEPEWLANVLRPFSEDPAAAVVGGETRVDAEGVYGLANALIYLFPPYTGARELRTSGYYFFNNVAFRRALLLERPVPSTVPVYRGHCYVHAQGLIRDGHEIRIQPRARASHAPPLGLAHFCWRYFLMGSDELTVRRILDSAGGDEDAPLRFRPLDDAIHCLGGAYLKAKHPFVRLWPIIREKPGRLLLLPFALPIVGAAFLLYAAGLSLAYFWPQLSVQAGKHWEAAGLSGRLRSDAERG